MDHTYCMVCLVNEISVEGTLPHLSQLHFCDTFHLPEEANNNRNLQSEMNNNNPQSDVHNSRNLQSEVHNNRSLVTEMHNSINLQPVVHNNRSLQSHVHININLHPEAHSNIDLHNNRSLQSEVAALKLKRDEAEAAAAAARRNLETLELRELRRREKAARLERKMAEVKALVKELKLLNTDADDLRRKRWEVERLDLVCQQNDLNLELALMLQSAQVQPPNTVLMLRPEELKSEPESQIEHEFIDLTEDNSGNAVVKQEPIEVVFLDIDV